MNSENKVVIPQPRTSFTSFIPSNSSPLREPKCQDSEDKHPFSESLKILGSCLKMTMGERKNSAFSVYEDFSSQSQREDNGERCSNSSGQAAFKPQIVSNKNRKWKKIKRTKREMSRLQTKNLNRYFRSKINEMLRDIKQNSVSDDEIDKAEQMLNILNKSNNIMFSELREIIKDEWLHKKLTRCSGILLKYIHKGKMGTYSKMIMLKYYNKIMKAIRNPDNFSFWK